jgi:hypothetical protein
MKPFLQTETNPGNRRERINRIKELVGIEMKKLMANPPRTPLASEDDIAEAIVDRLDPKRLVPELVRTCAVQQICYDLRRTSNPRRY